MSQFTEISNDLQNDPTIEYNAEEILRAPAPEVVVDDDEIDEDDEDEINQDIQLGFLEPGVNQTFLSKEWENWDGGQVGGRPIWLDPKTIPNPKNLQCKSCSTPLKFLLQV